MATHPYISGPGNIAQMVSHLRKSFPAVISSDTVKKLGIAPNNESYVMNALQFLGIIDPEGKKTAAAAKVFSHHKDDEFSKQFAPLVEKAYSSLFELHGDNAWKLGTDELITFFRQTDQTSSVIGGRQAGTFKVLAGLSGHGELREPKVKKIGNSTKSVKADKKSQPVKGSIVREQPAVDPAAHQHNKTNDAIGLTVRIEINLPADGTKETYDNIFKSIKENLLGG